MVMTVMSAMVMALVAANDDDAAALLQHQSRILGVAGTDGTLERQEDQKVLKANLGLDTISNDTVVAATGDGGCTPPDEMEVAKFIMYEIEAYMGTPDFCWRKKHQHKCWKRSTRGINRPGSKFYACIELYPCPKHTEEVGGLFPGCRQSCVGAQPVSCGVGACARTSGDCAREIISMTVGVLSAVKSSLLMAFPGGVLVKKVEMSAQQVSALHKGAKTGFPFALSKMKHVLTSESAQNAIIQKAKKKMLKYIKGDLECDVAKQMMTKTIAAVGKSMESKEPDDMDKFNFDTFDSDGMAQAIKEEKVSNAKTWLNTAGAVDPSGWLSAAANFVNPTCDDDGSWEEYEKLPEIKVSPSTTTSPCRNGCRVKKRRGKCPQGHGCK